MAIVGVAMDAQGPDLPRPYVENAGVTFPMLIDEQNLLGEMFGFRAIPNGLLVAEDGTIIHRKFGGFEIRDADRRRMVEGWIASGEIEDAESSASAALESSSMALFREGLERLQAGQDQEARALWRKAVDIDPKNLVVRKQLWALENPERFYDGAVDFDWQREQMDKGL